MPKNQRPNQLNDPWYIPAVPTGKSDFVAPNCPARALRYYNRYVTEHPELKKGRRRLFQSKTTTPERSLVQPLFQMDLHYYSGFSYHPSEQQKHPRNSQSSQGCNSSTSYRQWWRPEYAPAEAPSHPSTSETSVHKLTAYAGQAQSWPQERSCWSPPPRLVFFSILFC